MQPCYMFGIYQENILFGCKQFLLFHKFSIFPILPSAAPPTLGQCESTAMTSLNSHPTISKCQTEVSSWLILAFWKHYRTRSFWNSNRRTPNVHLLENGRVVILRIFFIGCSRLKMMFAFQCTNNGIPGWFHVFVPVRTPPPPPAPPPPPLLSAR